MAKQLPTHVLVNDFAIRSFRDIADRDYIAARMAFRGKLVAQYLWSAQQAVEKYLKCILLLNRIPANDVRHDLSKGLSKIDNSGKVPMNLTKDTREFIVDDLHEYAAIWKSPTMHSGSISSGSTERFGRFGDSVRLTRDRIKRCSLAVRRLRRFASKAATSKGLSTARRIRRTSRCFGRTRISERGCGGP